jgi:WD40 repeat protein
MFYGSITEHPLLVYLTALPFTPINTLLYNTFMMRDIPRIVGGFNQSWSPLLHMFQAHKLNVQSLAYFPDGTRIATSSPGDSLIRVWDVVSGSEVIAPLAGHTNGVPCLVVSPNGLRIASGSTDCTVRLWDTTTGAELLPPLRGHSECVRSVAFSSDGTRIASGSNDQTIRVWDAASGHTVCVLCGHMHHIHSVAFTLDGRHVISSSEDDTIVIWDALSGRHVEELDSCLASQIAVSPDGNSIGYYHDIGVVRIRQLDASSWSLDIQTGDDGIESMAFFPDGRHIIAIDGYIISIWQVSGTMIWASDPQKMMKCVALSPNGEQFVIGYFDGTVALWNTTSLSRDFPDPEPRVFRSALAAMSLRSDGRLLASSYSTDGNNDVSIHILDAQSGIEMTPLEGHGSEVRSIAFSPYGDLVASGSCDAAVRLWNLFSGAESLVLRGHKGYITCISFSHDGQRIASGSTDMTVRLWNTTSGAQIFPPLRHMSYIRAVAFSPDGTKVASAGGGCVLWDVISGTRIFQQVAANRCRSLVFSPDGQHIHIQAWDIMLVLDTNNARLNSTPYYLHKICSINDPIIITTDGLVVDVVTRRILSKLPSIVSISTIEAYTASTRSIAFISAECLFSIFIMHFPPCVLTSPMTWDENTYESKPI